MGRSNSYRSTVYCSFGLLYFLASVNLSATTVVSCNSYKQHRRENFFFWRFYLFLERRERREKERERNIDLLHNPKWGPGLQLRNVLWPGIELVTFQFIGWCSIHWVTPARVKTISLITGPGQSPVNWIAEVIWKRRELKKGSLKSKYMRSAWKKSSHC